MKLYKFRSFENFELSLDILVHERLYCAPYKELNDPFEGLFSTIEWKGGGLVRDLARPLARPLVRDIQGNWPHKIDKSLDDLPALDSAVRVCSLSGEMSDIRMWSHYAAGHTGCAIEMDIDPGTELFEVTYAPGLQEFADGISSETKASDILTFKTDHWNYEKEYRVITERKYYSIEGKVTGIFLGIRVSEIHKQLLVRSINGNIPIYETSVDQKLVKIKLNKRIN